MVSNRTFATLQFIQTHFFSVFSLYLPTLYTFTPPQDIGGLQEHTHAHLRV